ncbi:UDP-N-acetylmuramoyl-L-alanyl-D-glutamate--2,6-diaminopimelate ligase [Paraneptunicella aestuarii]|uniref:UDP-N-acetylmuramoyl-L-alanyl-D-glutamate--2, 6-diaminopimelate ligase n=1 Tax=Paraneptunicella aestuarii TaxID=2831148 RepID=UPI001E61B1B2|nr:UDP-N-acetylmuramoyl-L-alanyl-D-glutamate--2,6-diaminopimelate ligase [Paraneptunicella aestuarii]UAA38093.1 UDP-N-acetylmuramoyl-L-alanyl-D-glutamate--2,6-diaminopimelate ligase [Paraneptunicella aestuarii]
MTPKWQTRDLKTLLQPFGIEAPSIDIVDLAIDSREVGIHKAFVAVNGHRQDGREFIPQAVSLGAKVIIAETEDESEHGDTEMREHSIIIKFYDLFHRLSELSEAFYGEPSQSMKTIAVTGTNGKTSTAHFAAQLGQLLHKKAALIGTLGAGFLGDLQETINTTPVAVTMHRILAELSAEGADVVAFEASSHAMVQSRIKHLHTDVAIFTNLSRDHLDYHGDMEEYAKAKRMLLKQPGLKHMILNAGDAEHKNWLAMMPEGVTPVFFGVEIATPEQGLFCIAREVRYSNRGISFILHTSWGEVPVTTSLLGEFNVANLIGAVAAYLCLGAELSELEKCLGQIQPVPGRMELFRSEKNHLTGSGKPSATFVVDYAHTPDALEQVLASLKIHMKGKLWCLFGCGGERDQGKRPLMGKAAEQGADAIILTSDNSRSENTQDIIQDILSGMDRPDSEHILIVPDRKEAIKTALRKATPDDLVLLAGKGHETYQIINGQTLPYDERNYLNTLLQGEER